MSIEQSSRTPKSKPDRSHKSSKHSSKKRSRHDIDSNIKDELSPSKKQKSNIHASSQSTATNLPVKVNHSAASADQADNKSPFVEETISFYLPLSPIANDFAIQGLCAEHISPLLLTYYPPLRGFLLSYSNPRLSNTAHPAHISDSTHSDPGTASGTEDLQIAHVLSRANDEYGVTLTWLIADFVVLRPTPGTVVKGHVRLQNEKYLGLVCYNFFNATIERRRMPKEWKWVPGGSVQAPTTSDALKVAAGNRSKANSRGKETAQDVDSSDSSSVVSSDSEADSSSEDATRSIPNTDMHVSNDTSHADDAAEADETLTAGHFVSANGTKVEGVLEFTIKNYECAPSNERERGFISLEGTLLKEKDDKKVDSEVLAEFKSLRRRT